MKTLALPLACGFMLAGCFDPAAAPVPHPQPRHLPQHGEHVLGEVLLARQPVGGLVRAAHVQGGLGVQRSTAMRPSIVWVRPK